MRIRKINPELTKEQFHKITRRINDYNGNKDKTKLSDINTESPKNNLKLKRAKNWKRKWGIINPTNSKNVEKEVEIKFIRNDDKIQSITSSITSLLNS